MDRDGRQGRSGNEACRSPFVAAPTAAELERQARELERRAVDADEAVARAETARSGPSGRANNGSRRAASELRRLRDEADLLMDRALAARLEADRAPGAAGAAGAAGTAGAAGGNGPADAAIPVPVTSWSHGAMGWEELLSAALDEAANGPGHAGGGTDATPGKDPPPSSG